MQSERKLIESDRHGRGGRISEEELATLRKRWGDLSPEEFLKVIEGLTPTKREQFDE